MTDTMITARHAQPEDEPAPEEHPGPASRAPDLEGRLEPARAIAGRTCGLSSVRVLVTLTVAALAAFLTWKMWDAYMGAPWTRDGSVRVYVATMAPEVAGRIVQLPVRDNQFVHKGDLLLVIEPTNYEIAVKIRRGRRRSGKGESRIMRWPRPSAVTCWTTDAVSEEVKQTFKSNWESRRGRSSAGASQSFAARVNLERTRIVSPVNGYVTNLLAQLGDYASVGENLISVRRCRFILGRWLL